MILRNFRSHIPSSAILGSISCASARAHTRCFSASIVVPDPVRILFCGADEFSIYSLRALHELQQQRPESIASIDVVCRPGKRVGRGLKQVREVPIKHVAHDLHLPLHQLDTFTGWSPPSPVDLIVAVSFGLMVPARLLKAATFGGLNVHPSLLPDLRGPAPIQHALLQARSHTGVTLQTMHPTRFDHGSIVSQTPLPGIAIQKHATPQQLIQQLGLVGAELLRSSVADKSFASISSTSQMHVSEGLSHAPKISPEDRKIDWQSWTAEQIMRRDRVLGRLWDVTTYQACHAKEPRRVTFEGPWLEVPREDLHDKDQGYIEGVPTLSHIDGYRKPRLAFYTSDKKIISPSAATIESEPKGKAMPSLVQAVKASYRAAAEGQAETNTLGTRIWC